MTIRTRLTIWYAVVLAASLLLISLGTFRELHEKVRDERRTGFVENALDETSELMFQVGLPAILLGLLGGWWLTRRTLDPLSKLTQAAERIDERTLSQPLPRSGNGDELDRLTEVLNAMTARLHQSFTRVRDFTLHASHELKTPLTVLCGEAESALRNRALTPAERDRCASQLEELRRLARIVDSLTLLAKVDAGQVSLAFEPLRLHELVRDAFADTQILAQSSGIRVELTACEEAITRGDAHRLRQLLLNLADNAVKYNLRGGIISIALRRANGSAELSIANTGAGISPDRLPRVFDRFFRGDPAHSTEVDGCGLGLSIARWIVTAHGGNIALTSVPGELTTVTVHLPVVSGA